MPFPGRETQNLGRTLSRAEGPILKGWQRIAVLVVLLAGALLVWQSTRIKSRPTWPVLAGERPLVVADRGGAGRWPENTLLAFQHSSNNGFAILADVRRTADGQLVAMRDAALDRTTDGNGPVAGRTLEELQTLDAAYHFSPDGDQTFPFRGRSVRIPDLAAILRSFPRDRIFLHVREPGLEEKLWEVLEQTGAADRVVIYADDDATMQSIRLVAQGRVPTAASATEAEKFGRLIRWHLARFYEPQFDVLVLPGADLASGKVSPAVLEWAARRGIKVHAADVAEAELVPALAELKIDAIISERPDLMLEAVQKLGN